MSKRLGADLRGDAPDPTLVVEELELAQRSQVQGLRSSVQVQVRLLVQPADSEARGTPLAGTTRELRSKQTTAVFTRPVAVGSFFQLTFDEADVGMPPVFGRCDRCTLLAEDQFEARFQFLHAVTQSGNGANPDS